MTTYKLKKSVAVWFSIFTVLLFSTGFVMAQKTSLAAATKEFNRLTALSAALKKIPVERMDKEPHKSFIKKNDKDIVYSEPAGTWFVRSERFWDLQKKYRSLAIADKIAWTAAENPLPGECEGYVNCYFYVIRSSYGEYLSLYPKGTYSKRAVQKTIEFLAYMADDAASGKKNYEGPTDASDRANLVEMINELRGILAKVSHPDTAKARSQLKQIEDAYK